MKRLQIGFTAIITILAMSFTFSPNSLSMIKKEVTDGCYRMVVLDYYSTWLGYSLNVTLTASDVIIVGTPGGQSTSWPGTVQINNWKFPGEGYPLEIPNAPISTSDVLWEFYSVLDIGTSCPAPYQKFCCYKVESNRISAVCFRSN